MTDIEIAQSCKMEDISVVADKIGLNADDIEQYGKYKAKVTFKTLKALQEKASHKENRGKLILVTAMTPTAAGEGKSTVTIALGDALRKNGKNAVIALREPSLGPCFGIKGGACGGGYAQVVPMEDINLHFTGDIHAITAACNLMASLIDNHIQQGNELNIDPRTITWKRCVDLNDRSLRNVIIGLGGRVDGSPRESHFQITVASEIMAIICFSRSITELKERISKIIIGQTFDRCDVSFGQLKCTGAVAALLKDALRPNLVQTLEGTPAFIHGGPFANIAHGCNSLNATLCALSCGDYVVTEAGFAADLGAEKFFDIKCRVSSLEPSVAVIVATIRALKMHGGVAKNNLSDSNAEAIQKGFSNLEAHISNLKKFGVGVVVALNKFSSDTKEEIELLDSLCQECDVKCVVCEGWARGGEGALNLSYIVEELCRKDNNFKPLYEDNISLEDKILTIATKIYHADSILIEEKAQKKLKLYEANNWGHLPMCIAKTQNSISHDKNKLGSPKGYVFPIRDVQLYSGAGFVVAFAGDIVDMPGLPKMPSALAIDVNDDGQISGLF